MGFFEDSIYIKYKEMKMTSVMMLWVNWKKSGNLESETQTAQTWVSLQVFMKDSN